MTNNVVAFPAKKSNFVVLKLTDTEAEIKMDYHHVVDALAMYLQSYPFGLGKSRDITDVDMGLPVDEHGFVYLDVKFGDASGS